MSATPTFMSNGGEVICADHAGRYLAAALKKRPDLKTTSTPLDVWKRVDGDVYKCDTCATGTGVQMCDACNEKTYHVKHQCQKCSPISTRTTPTKENTMSIAIATPVRKAKKTAAKKTAAKTTPTKKETTVSKTTTKPATKKAPVKKVAKPVAKKAPAAKATPKAAPKKATNAEPKMFIVYRDITNDVTAQARKAKSFSPIRYESVIAGKSIVSARKALAELKGDDAAQYDVIPSYDPKTLTNKALARFDGGIEKVESTPVKNTFKVTLRNIEGLTQDEIRELALLGWAVEQATKSKKPVGNEGMLDRDFEFGELKSLKNNRANLVFTAK